MLMACIMYSEGAVWPDIAYQMYHLSSSIPSRAAQMPPISTHALRRDGEMHHPEAVMGPYAQELSDRLPSMLSLERLGILHCHIPTAKCAVGCSAGPRQL